MPGVRRANWLAREAIRDPAAVAPLGVRDMPVAEHFGIDWIQSVSRGDKRDLGASLVLTGVVAIGAGLMLHLALRTHAIDSAVHLGYLVGLVGLLLLLIGLLVVY
jgi:hypothetical protein